MDSQEVCNIINAPIDHAPAAFDPCVLFHVGKRIDI